MNLEGGLLGGVSGAADGYVAGTEQTSKTNIAMLMEMAKQAQEENMARFSDKLAGDRQERQNTFVSGQADKEYGRKMSELVTKDGQPVSYEALAKMPAEERAGLVPAKKYESGLLEDRDIAKSDRDLANDLVKLDKTIAGQKEVAQINAASREEVKRLGYTEVLDADGNPTGQYRKIGSKGADEKETVKINDDGTATVYDPKTGQVKRVGRPNDMSADPNYQKAQEMAQEWVKGQTGTFSSDKKDLKDFGGNRQQALAAKTEEFYNQITGGQAPPAPAEKGLLDNDPPPIVKGQAEAAEQPKSDTSALDAVTKRANELREAAAGGKGSAATPPSSSSQPLAEKKPISQKVGELAGRGAKGMLAGATGTRDALEKLGTPEWWAANFAGLSENSKRDIDAIVGTGRVSAADLAAFVEERTAKDNKSVEEVLANLKAGFAKGYK